MSYELMFQKAVKLQQNGALNEAEQLYRQILETAPQNADVLNMLGLIAQAKGLHDEAVNYFYRAADFAPQHFPIFFNLGISLAASGYLLEAAEAYKKALKLKPDLKEAFFGLGNVYWQINQKDAAAEAFQNALKLDAGYLDAAANLAELQDDEDTLKKIAAENHSDARTFYYLGRRMFAKADYQNAAHYLQKAEELLESDEIKTLLGETFYASKHYQEALPLFYQAYKLNPHNATAALHIADLETENGNFAEAEKFYRKALENDIHNVQAHANLANLLCKRKRTLEALEEYRAAVRLAPEMPELSYNLAIILKTLEEYEQALALMFNAFYLAPQHIDWSLNIAETITLFYGNAPEKALKIAENYENVLHNINYAVVDKIAEIAPDLNGKILDLGCGTGLIGLKLKNPDNTFYGVDLSKAMLQKANQKNVYKVLEQADAVAYLQQHKNEFSAIVAADVFCYFGNLEKLLKEAAPTKIIFSIESDLQTENYKIQPNGRYKHNLLYVENILKSVGYTNIKSYPLVLRKENNKNVDGLIFTAAV